jgi:hypothetical protein
MQLVGYVSQAMDCSDHLNSPFEISEIQKTLVLHTLSVDQRQVLWFVRPLKKGSTTFRNENEENNMISKITAILAAALVLGSAGVRRRKPTGTMAGKRPTRTPTIRIREISATGTQTTPSLTPLLGQCLTVLLRTKFYSNRIGSFLRAIARMAATPSALLPFR